MTTLCVGMASVRSRVPALPLLVVAAVPVWFGVAMAVGLFDHLSRAAVAVLRVVGATIG